MSSNTAGASLWATCAAVAATSALLGFLAGKGASLGITVSAARATHNNPSIVEADSDLWVSQRGKDYVSDGEDESDDDSQAGDDDELTTVKATGDEPCKLVLVVRTDLGMNKGKIAAQCGHATLGCYKALAKSNPALVRHWERTGQAKIAVQISSEEDLLILQATAKSLGICARSIQDAGRTQVAAGSTTVLGLGPAPVRVINQVTGHLKLL